MVSGDHLQFRSIKSFAVESIGTEADGMTRSLTAPGLSSTGGDLRSSKGSVTDDPMAKQTDFSFAVEAMRKYYTVRLQQAAGLLSLAPCRDKVDIRIVV